MAEYNVAPRDGRPSRPICYLVAVGIVGVASLFRLAVDPILLTHLPFLGYVVGVVFVTWFCGIEGGLISTILGAIVGNFLFVAPRYEWIPSSADLVVMVMFALVATLMIRAVSSWRNMERRLRTQATELERANRIKDEFLATLGHELRTPLNAVVGWSSILLKGGLSPEAVRKAHEAIARNAEAQRALVEDVLDVSRIVSGRLRLETDQTDVAVPLRLAVETVRPAADEKQVRIVTDYGGGPAGVWGDSRRLEQVFWNLLLNAVKFSKQGGQVRVSVTRLGGDIVVQVEDSGVGMAPHLIPHIFERFRQADSSSSRAHTGLGLGLAIVQHLVELHGGTVSAESRGEGQGATFTVRLPHYQIEERRHADASSQPRPVPPVAPTLGATANLCGVRVFLIDDQADSRELGASVLREAGAMVDLASSAQDALARLEHVSPDVLLIDIAMPGMDGYALLQAIRHEKSRVAQVPAIAFTAYVREEDKRTALSAGFQMHLAKPIDPAALVRGVASVLPAERPAAPPA